MLELTTPQARRLLMQAQGLMAPPGRKASRAELLGLIRQLGFVQVDSINVVERAHHLTLWSRLEGYRRAWLDKLLEERRLFEHWTHDASLIPTEFLGHWHHRHARYEKGARAHRWWVERLGDDWEEGARAIRQRIEREGPLRSRDFEGAGEPGGWWSWKKPKAYLEFLWRTGALAVRQRENFQKVYDLTERVLPAVPPSSEAEFVDWACRSALERLGVGTAAEIAGFWAMADLPRVRAWCARHALKVRVEGQPAFALQDLPERLADLDEAPGVTRLLSPFDPVLRDRKRALRLFGFDYRFEAFVPAPRRKYGYYVLPVLEGERLVARLDPKLHRAESRLEVQGLWWEPGLKVGKQRRQALQTALEKLASFLGAGTLDGQAISSM